MSGIRDGVSGPDPRDEEQEGVNHMIGHDKPHAHEHHDDHTDRREHHGHTHGAVDPSILTTERGIWAVKRGGPHS
jgi:hypothetical protein